MNMKTAKIMVCFGLMSIASAHQFTYCNQEDRLGINQVTLTPDPPQVGKNLTVTVTGVSKDDLSNITLQLQVDAFGIKIADLNMDMCQDLEVNCPLRQGQLYNASINYEIPSQSPKGIDVYARLVAKDAQAKQISCVKIETHLAKANTGLLSQTREDTIQYLFKAWRKQYGHHFQSPLHFVEALKVFTRHTLAIQKHNSQPNVTYHLAHNRYSYISNEQFRKTFTPLKMASHKDRLVKPSQQPTKINLPSSVDWRGRGAVTPVKNQQQCGSCWAFSTTGAVEAAYFLKTGNLTSFSEQELVSCDKTDMGCNGGQMDNAFSWIQQQGGLCSELDYPYHSGNGNTTSCKKMCKPIKGSEVTSHVDVNSTEIGLKTALSIQPVSIAIEADGLDFQLYHSGVYTAECGTNLDHGVLAVGYGTEDGQDYWLVKNSWGTSWGQAGYIKLARGKSQTGGQCGILLSASYPLLA